MSKMFLVRILVGTCLLGALACAEDQAVCLAPTTVEDCENQAECCEISILNDHTNPPITIGKGNSLVWTKKVFGPNPKLKVGSTEVFVDGVCAKKNVLNYALIGKGTNGFEAWTVKGVLIKDLTKPFVFSGTGPDEVEYRLEITFGRMKTSYMLFRDNVPCPLNAHDTNHKVFVELPVEFGYLQDKVRWNKSNVDMDKLIEFTTYER